MKNKSEVNSDLFFDDDLIGGAYEIQTHDLFDAIEALESAELTPRSFILAYFVIKWKYENDFDGNPEQFGVDFGELSGGVATDGEVGE